MSGGGWFALGMLSGMVVGVVLLVLATPALIDWIEEDEDQ